MVKNTGSQSAASVGYGTMQTMSSTVKSGMVATETYFFNANNLNNLRTTMDALLNAENSDKESKKPFILGRGDKNKEKLAASQHFTSRVSDFDEAHRNPEYIRFEVNAGRSEGGKNLKKALAYYNIDNTYNQITVESDDFGGSNSFTASDNGSVDAGNSGATFHGHATFEHGLLLQNNKPVTFVKDANGEGSVYVTGTTTINNTQKVVFEVDAYFDDDVLIQNIPSNYEKKKKNTGFNGNFFAGVGKTIEFGGHLWFNGDLKAAPNTYDPQKTNRLVSTSTNKNFYYSNSISMETAAMDGGMCKKCDLGGFNGCVPNTTNCCVHKCDHKVKLSEQIKNFANTDPATGWSANIDNIPAKMKAANGGDGKGMTTIDERKEPEIDVKNIADGKKFLEIYDGKTLDGVSQLNGNALQEFYDKTENDEKYKDYYDNGHLLLKIPQGMGLTASGGGEFNRKVILDVEGSLHVNSGFYSSGAEASTLIYTGAAGILDNFGVVDGGTFRGLVYVDKANTKSQTFWWGENTQIQGAVIIKGGKLTWNDSSKNMDIYRNNDVLANYAFLKGNNTGGKKKTTVEHEDRGLKLSAFGYYFY
jgi:hypothetical protein